MSRRKISDITSAESNDNIVDSSTPERHKRVATTAYRSALASLACESCRNRKSKCDERRPKCSLCERLSLTCEYRMSTVKSDPAVKEILEAVQRIEVKLDASIDRTNIFEITNDVPQQPVSTFSLSPRDRMQSSIRSPSTKSARRDEQDHWESTSPQLAIPYRHTTAAEKLLSWPTFKQRNSLAGIDLGYPLSMAISRDIAGHRHQSGGIDELQLTEALTHSHMQRLTDFYFDDFHTSSPVLNLEHFKNDILYKLQDGWPANDQIGEDQRCLCLFVFALGSLALATRYEKVSSDSDDLLLLIQDRGFGFLQAGKERLHRLPSINLVTAQCYLLCGLFHSRNFESVQYYWAVNQACFILMTLLSSSSTLGLDGERIFWVSYLQESGILAELDFPPSGISRFENEVPLPFSGLHSSSEPESDWPFFFLAQIALRRLLNRVHTSLYNHDTSRNNGGFNSFAQPSLTVISELNQQLEQWRCHLPPTLQFSTLSSDDTAWDLEGTRARLSSRDSVLRWRSPARSNLVGHLRGRYCAAKAIIYRPFAFKMLHYPIQTLGSEDYNCLRMCLQGQVWIALASRVGMERLPLLQNPLNPCRSFYAAAILCRVINSTPHLRDCLPPGWEVIYHLQQAVKNEAAMQSPIIQRDLELLDLLDMEFASTSPRENNPEMYSA